MSDLIVVKKKKTSGKLEIISEIAASTYMKCINFAELLLRDTAVKRLRKKNKGEDDVFVYEVLENWLSRNDDDTDDPAAPRTWEALVQCMEDAGLDGVLVKAVRDHFC